MKNEQPNFSIILGGPLFQLLRRLRLTTPALELLKKRVICITLFAWLPLLLLTLADGTAWGNVGVPFFYDMEVQTRFLVALPLLIVAELWVHKQLWLIVEQFIDRDIITEKTLPRFKELIASAMKLRNSIVIKLFLLLLAFVGGYYLWNYISVLDKEGSWYAHGAHLTPAAYWYVFVSRPLFQFLLLRWYFRIFIWVLFLWQTSELKLNLIPTHPDHAAGLGFLAESTQAFFPLIIAHGAVMAGLIANSIFFNGAKLTGFLFPVLGAVLFLLLLVLGPLLVFSPKLLRAKRAGLHEYGILSSLYVNAFDLKWVHGEANDRLLGSPDIQSLADLGHSFQLVQDIKPFVFGKESVLYVAAFTLLPLLPLIFTMIPLQELVQKLLQIIVF